MSEKRRGLGRGLGALIPTGTEGDRPVDVFFPHHTGGPAGTPQGPPEWVRTTPRAGRPASATAAAATAAAATAARELAADLEAARALEAAAQAKDAAVDLVSPATVEPAASGTEAGDQEIAVTLLVDPSDSAPDLGNAARNDAEAKGVGDPQAALAVAPRAEPGEPTERSAGAGATTTGGPWWEASRAGSDATEGSAEAPAPAAPAPSPASQSLLPVPGARFAELPVLSIRPNARQPRTAFDEEAMTELVESIREIGVLQPIVVREVPGDDGTEFELIMGERRWRATQEAGLDTVPAIIRDTDDSDLLRDALLENLHRSNLNPLEEAAAYRQLLDDFGCTHEELARRILRSRPQISNTLRLLRLPPLVQRRLAAGVLSAGHARALLGLDDGAAIERLAQRIVAEGLSVRATEEIVSLGGDRPAGANAPRPRAVTRNAALDDLAARLSDRFETRVKIALGKSKGKLTVEFASVRDLERILETLSPQDQVLVEP